MRKKNVLVWLCTIRFRLAFQLDLQRKLRNLAKRWEETDDMSSFFSAFYITNDQYWNFLCSYCNGCKLSTSKCHKRLSDSFWLWKCHKWSMLPAAQGSPVKLKCGRMRLIAAQPRQKMTFELTKLMKWVDLHWRCMSFTPTAGGQSARWQHLIIDQYALCSDSIDACAATVCTILWIVTTLRNYTPEEKSMHLSAEYLQAW